MNVFLTLTTAGSNSGPFNLYSEEDGFTTPFETGVSRFSLLSGYLSTDVPEFTNIVRVKSVGICINYVDIILTSSNDTTTTTTTATPTTTTTTTTATPTTTTTTTTATPAITNFTEINIWFDNSGSMNSTLAPLQQMRDNLLKDCIGPIYGYDPAISGSDALYNIRVKVFNFNFTILGYERFVRLLGTDKNFSRITDTSVNQVLNFTFADESNSYGYGSSGGFTNTTRTEIYDVDVSYTRSQILTSPYIKGIAFQVNTLDPITGNSEYPGFRGLTQATFVNTGVYAPPYNLSDISNFNYELDLIAGTTSTYYLSKVVSGLNTLGFTISCTPVTTTTTTTLPL